MTIQLSSCFTGGGFGKRSTKEIENTDNKVRYNEMLLLKDIEETINQIKEINQLTFNTKRRRENKNFIIDHGMH